MQKIILGSGSPRRKEILEMAGYSIDVSKTDVEEIIPENTPHEEAAEYLANLKAGAFKTIAENEIIITADTVVIIDNEILGKPKDKADAQLMLQKLSGKTHQVITGVCLKNCSKSVSFSDLTLVTFSPLTDEMIDYYIERHKPFDKAGAYGVQEFMGMVAVEKMEGSFYNVMGLPIHKVYQELQNF